jgi:arsenate reductase (thioredoxin)
VGWPLVNRALVAALLLISCHPQQRETVVFICPHGGAKSLIAASYFNRMAVEKHLPYTAVAVAAEHPYDSVPANIANFLEKDGFRVRSFKPRPVSRADLRGASRVISVGCDLSKVDTRGTAIETWDDVPLVDDGLPQSAAAIRKHVIVLIDQLGSR